MSSGLKDMGHQWTVVERAQIEDQLAKLLSSASFGSAKLLQHLLKYLVEETLAGRGDRINQASVAIDVLGRDESFDAAIDSVVRVEARRLRSRLIEYYYEDGKRDAIRFELPKGHYIPSISFSPGPGNAEVAASAANITTGAHVEDASIAVLAFVNLSDDSSNEYFSDGISEELLTLLAKIPELRVPARTSSFAFKGKNVNVAQIGEQLHVAHVLEGSVRKAGDQVRITAQLIQVSDGFHLWSESWDRTLLDIFAIQEEIATKVVAHLKITLLGAPPSMQEIEPEAYALYLQARHVGRQGTPEAWDQCIEFYKQALEIDSDYVAAWEGMAAMYSDQIGWGLRRTEDGCALVREAVGNALAIDPGYAMGHARLSWIAMIHERDPAAAARHCRRALDLNPTDLDILSYAAVLAAYVGRLQEAIAIRQYVVARDPVNAKTHRLLGNCYLWAGRPDEAMAAFRTTLTLSPRYLGTQQLIGLSLLRQGKPEEALAAIEQESAEVYRLIGLVMVHHALGQASASDAALEELIEKYEQDAAYNIAFTLAFRGEVDRAFEWLDKAEQYHDSGLSQIVVEPLFESLHSDPRWQAFLTKIGKSKQQLDAIEFTAVLPGGD